MEDLVSAWHQAKFNEHKEEQNSPCLEVAHSLERKTDTRRASTITE